MSNHNYSQYSNKKKTSSKASQPKQPVVEQDNAAFVAFETEPVIAEEFTTTVHAPVEPMEVKMEQPVAEPEMVKGVVANCAKLNVRAEPKVTADVVCVLDNSSEININVAKSNKDWFAVCTAIGAEGYCMRKFVNVKM